MHILQFRRTVVLEQEDKQAHMRALAHARMHVHAHTRAKILISSLLQFPFMFALLLIKLMFVTSFI